MARESKRQTLIDTAIRLFSEHGYHAVGIDALLREAGVAKRTLYNHFASKEDLIVAALEAYDREFKDWFVAQVEAAASDPRGKLLAVFDVAQLWFTQESFFGCMFIKAVSEYAQGNEKIRAVSVRFKQFIRAYFGRLSRDMGVRDAGGLADELALLFEGAIVTAQVMETPEAAQTAKRAAAVLLAQAS